MARILVLDSNARVRRSLTEFLTSGGHETHETSSGALAIRRCVAGNYDLLITDMFMPEVDGVAVILKIRKSGCDMPVIAMSGGADMDKRYYLQSCQRPGGDICFEKPFGVSALLDTIDSLVSDDIWYVDVPGPAADDYDHAGLLGGVG